MVALHSPLKLKRLLRTHCSSTTPPSPTTPDKALLPNHLLYEIARQSELREILKLSLCAQRLRKLLAPRLYATVELKTNRHCKTTLLALSKRPELAQLVRNLTVRVNNPEWTDPSDEIDEDIIASLIEQIATAGSFKSLDSFEWDGLEHPPDDLWLSLKVSCLNLKRICTTIGDEPLNPSSPLWEFNDLRKFGLTIKCQSLNWLADGLPKPEKLPRQLWEMLLERSPRLEELTLGGPAPSPRMFDIRHVTSGRWPRLRSVTLGDMVLISAEKEGEVEATKAFHAFFLFHQELRHIGLEHAGGSAFFPGAFDFGSTEASLESRSVLPKLESFSGSLKYIKTLPLRTRKQLKSVNLTGIHHNFATVGPTTSVLRDLIALENLRFWVDLTFATSTGGVRRSSLDGIGIGRTGGEQVAMIDDEKVLRSILDACPETLKHFDVACFTRPGFSIREFSSTLKHAPPSLMSFTLTKVHRSGDEDLTRCAARITTENPGLKHFTLRTTHGSWFSATSCGRVRALGVYDILSDALAEECPMDRPIRNSTDTTLDSSPPRRSLSPSTREIPVEGRGVHVDSPVYVDEPTGAETDQRSLTTVPSPNLSSSSIPTAIIVHEWGPKGLSLSGKEFARHVIYTLTEKEVESSRVHQRDAVRRRLACDLSTANNPGISLVSRRSSLASSGSSWQGQAYGFSYSRNNGQLAASGSSFGSFGYKNEQLFGSNLGSIGHRSGRKHSSSMSSVLQAANGLDQAYGYGTFAGGRYQHSSITWADQHGTTPLAVRRDNENRLVEGYVFV